MKRYRILAVWFALAFALAIPGGLARAQVGPVVANAGSTASPKAKGNWLKAEVIHFDSNSIIVRDEANARVIHTFTYAPRLKDKMQQLSDRGGYQYGDKVKILFQPGQTVALKIVGKPSKPL
jgi:hypothetical protein